MNNWKPYAFPILSIARQQGWILSFHIHHPTDLFSPEFLPLLSSSLEVDLNREAKRADFNSTSQQLFGFSDLVIKFCYMEGFCVPLTYKKPLSSYIFGTDSSNTHSNNITKFSIRSLGCLVLVTQNVLWTQSSSCKCLVQYMAMMRPVSQSLEPEMSSKGSGTTELSLWVQWQNTT